MWFWRKLRPTLWQRCGELWQYKYKNIHQNCRLNLWRLVYWLFPPQQIINAFAISIKWRIFMPRAWKVRPGHLVIGLSVRPSVCPSVRNSFLLTNKVQYLKFGWLYSNQTWTVSSSMGFSHFTDITCPCGWGGDFVAAGGIHVSQTHVEFCLNTG